MSTRFSSKMLSSATFTCTVSTKHNFDLQNNFKIMAEHFLLLQLKDIYTYFEIFQQYYILLLNFKF